MSLLLPADVVATGVVSGLAYGLLAVGLVLVYRSSRVINIAHGEIGAFGAAVLALLVRNGGLSWWAALPLAMAAGAAIAAVVELVVVRRLQDRAPTLLLVATIGVSQLVLVARVSLPDVRDALSVFPAALDRVVQAGPVRLDGAELAVLVLAPATAALITLVLTRTPFGLAVRATATNRDAAALVGVSTARIGTAVWAASGALATLTVVLLEPLLRLPTAGTPATFGPELLLKGFVAAMVGRLHSLPLAVAGGIGLGVAEQLTLLNASPGARDLLLLVAVLLLVLLRGPGSGSGEPEELLSLGVGPERPVVPAGLADLWWVRNLGRLGWGTAGLVALAVPLLVHGAGPLYLLSRVWLVALVGLSLVVLTGWAGQLSLGQLAFFGTGALVAAALVQRGVAFPAAVLQATLVGALVAVLVGIPALRVRGLFLAITTLAFAVAADNTVFRSRLLVGPTETALLPPPTFFGFGPLGNGGYYVLCLGALAAGALAVTALRRSGAGRAMIAVGADPRRAAAATLAPALVRLSVFAVSGALAAFSGALFAGLKTTVGYQDFTVTGSLAVVALVLIGGSGSVGGTVLGALYVLGLPAVLGDSATVALLTSSVGLLLLLLYLPEGLDGLLQRARAALLRRVEAARDAPAAAPGDIPAVPAAGQPTVRDAAQPMARTAPLTAAGPVAPALTVSGLRVDFGGRRALDGVDLYVLPGEVLGLIGGNGAGKSTLLDVVSGFRVPDAGRILLDGVDVTGASATQRARAGLGRMFQDPRGAADLSVRETVLLSLEACRRAEVLPALLGLPVARRDERAKRARAEEVMGTLGLGAFADRRVATLSTGMRRVVDLACLVAGEFSVLLLDEPTAGLAQRETEAFVPVLAQVREATDATVVLVDHDLVLVGELADRVQCLGAGRTLAVGTMDEVRADPAVVISYLGTDLRVVERSGPLVRP